MIKLRRQPGKLDFVNNPLIFQIKGTEFAIKKGGLAEAGFLMTDVPPVDSTLEFVYKEKTHVLKFVNDIKQDIPDGIDCLIARDTIENMCHAIYNYAPICNNFKLHYFDDFFFIEAITPGEEYNINITQAPDSWFPFDGPGSKEELHPDYHFSVKLYVSSLSNFGTYTLFPEFRVDPNENMHSHFDVSKTLRAHFINDFDVPSFDNNHPYTKLLQTVKYYLVITEKSRDSIISTFITETYEVFNGKINYLNYEYFNISSWINSQKKFLSNIPRQVYTNHSAHHYLYYLWPNKNEASVVIKINISSKDSNAPLEYISDKYTLIQNAMIVIPINQMLKSILNPTSLDSVSVSVINDDTKEELTLPVTFYYLPKTIHSRAFIFQNQFGLFDTINTRIHKNTFKVNKNAFRVPFTQEYLDHTNEIHSDNPEVEDLYEAETGPITSDMIKHYKEMAMSKAVFLQSNNRYIKVFVEKGSFNITDEDNELHNFKFKYKPSITNDTIVDEGELLPQA